MAEGLNCLLNPPPIKITHFSDDCWTILKILFYAPPSYQYSFSSLFLLPHCAKIPHINRTAHNAYKGCLGQVIHTAFIVMVKYVGYEWLGLVGTSVCYCIYFVYPEEPGGYYTVFMPPLPMKQILVRGESKWTAVIYPELQWLSRLSPSKQRMAFFFLNFHFLALFSWTLDRRFVGQVSISDPECSFSCLMNQTKKGIFRKTFK